MASSLTINFPTKITHNTQIITCRTHFDNSYLEGTKYGPATIQSDLQKYSYRINNIAIYWFHVLTNKIQDYFTEERNEPYFKFWNKFRFWRFLVDPQIFTTFPYCTYNRVK